MPILKTLCLTASFALCGCAHLNVRLVNFMPPDRGTLTAKLPAGYVVENRVLSHEGQRIGITYAWHPHSHAIILFCGGDAFHRTIEGGEALEALAWDADVVLFDYPGYGDTTGPPSVAAILDAAEAVYDHIFGLQSSAGKKRVLYGFSMGGLVVAQLAHERRADGIVLEATPPSVRRWADSRIPFALKPVLKVRIEPQLAEIDAVAALAHFRGKLLLLASRADHTVPARLSFEIERRLRKQRRDVAWVEFPNCRHGEIDRSPTFPATLHDFIARVGAPP